MFPQWLDRLLPAWVLVLNYSGWLYTKYYMYPAFLSFTWNLRMDK